jgi:hypothetical protein
MVFRHHSFNFVISSSSFWNETTVYPYFITLFRLSGSNGKKERKIKKHPHEKTTIPLRSFPLRLVPICSAPQRVVALRAVLLGWLGFLPLVSIGRCPSQRSVLAPALLPRNLTSQVWQGCHADKCGPRPGGRQAAARPRRCVPRPEVSATLLSQRIPQPRPYLPSSSAQQQEEGAQAAHSWHRRSWRGHQLASSMTSMIAAMEVGIIFIMWDGRFSAARNSSYV